MQFETRLSDSQSELPKLLLLIFFKKEGRKKSEMKTQTGETREAVLGADGMQNGSQSLMATTGVGEVLPRSVCLTVSMRHE